MCFFLICIINQCIWFHYQLAKGLLNQYDHSIGDHVSDQFHVEKLSEDSLDRFLVSQFNVYNEKSLKRIHRGFKGLQDTLEASFI